MLSKSMEKIKIKEKPKMPTFQKVLYIIWFIIMVYLFIILGTKDYHVPINKLNDKDSFNKEYNLNIDNIFVYKNGKEALNILNSNGILFMAYPENIWSDEYATILNRICKKYGITEIGYYNFKAARSVSNRDYLNIVNRLKSYNFVTDNGVSNIYSPTVVFAKNGNIIYYDNETSIIKGNITPEEYWTNSKILNKEAEFEYYLNIYLG